MQCCGVKLKWSHCEAGEEPHPFLFSVYLHIDNKMEIWSLNGDLNCSIHLLLKMWCARENILKRGVPQYWYFEREARFCFCLTPHLVFSLCQDSTMVKIIEIEGDREREKKKRCLNSWSWYNNINTIWDIIFHSFLMIASDKIKAKIKLIFEICFL